jgi:hypothetical protein
MIHGEYKYAGLAGLRPSGPSDHVNRCRVVTCPNAADRFNYRLLRWFCPRHEKLVEERMTRWADRIEVPEEPVTSLLGTAQRGEVVYAVHYGGTSSDDDEHLCDGMFFARESDAKKMVRKLNLTSWNQVYSVREIVLR